MLDVRAGAVYSLVKLMDHLMKLKLLGVLDAADTKLLEHSLILMRKAVEAYEESFGKLPEDIT